MANVSVTYSFSNSTTADATQVNQNFTDIINGTSDGTKDFSISALTCAGNVTFNGNTTIGNASSDDLTITASLASTIPIKTTATYNIGSSTKGLLAIYLSNASSNTSKLQGDSSISSDLTHTLPKITGTLALATFSTQIFTSGSGTYTTPSGVKRIRVRMVGGGGGGAGSSTQAAADGGAGGAGGDSTFGTSLLNAGGGGGASGSASGGGGGGTSSLGGSTGVALSGGGGGAAALNLSTFQTQSGHGGYSAFGGGGRGVVGNTGGVAGATNTGGGGSGGAANVGASVINGAGGGSGGYVEAYISSPSATYSYSVGAAGTAGAAGTSGNVGGAGGSGLIIVEEFY